MRRSSRSTSSPATTAARSTAWAATTLFVITISLLLALTPLLGPVARAAAEPVGRFPLALPTILEAEPGSNDCAVGSLAADAVRAAAGTRLALVNHGDLAGDLAQGELTRDEVARVFAVDRSLARATLTPAELRALLEPLLARVTVDPRTERLDRAASAFAGFPSVSGFTLSYDASAPAGQRITALTLDDGTALDLSDTRTQLTLAASETLLAGGYGTAAVEATPLGLTLTDALCRYVAGAGATLTELNWRRVTVRGARENAIVGMLPGPLLAGVLILLVVLCLLLRRKRAAATA